MKKSAQPLSNQEQQRIDDFLQRIRPKIFEPWSITPNPAFHFLLPTEQLFCTRTLQTVADSYKDREMSIDKHISLIVKIFRVLSRKTKSDIDPFQSCLIAMMHDVGKALIGEKVFCLPRALTESEKVIKRRHSVLGEAVCKKLGDPFDHIAPIIRAHHEDWNGTGFPDGLKGRAIPIAARLLRVADVMSALRINRHYRTAYSKHQTLELMREAQEREEIFDPSLMPYLDSLIALT